MDNRSPEYGQKQEKRDATGKNYHARRPLSRFDRMVRNRVVQVAAALGLATAAATGVAQMAAPENPTAPQGAAVNEAGNVMANTVIGAVELGQEITKKTGEPNKIYAGDFKINLEKVAVWSDMAPVSETSADSGRANSTIDIKNISTLDGTKIDIQGLTDITITNATVINKELPDNASEQLGPNIEIVAKAQTKDNKEMTVFIPLGKYNTGAVEEMPSKLITPFVDLQKSADGKYESPAFGITSDKVNIVSYVGQENQQTSEPLTQNNAPQN